MEYFRLYPLDDEKKDSFTKLSVTLREICKRELKLDYPGGNYHLPTGTCGVS